jgi:hypothetical protein
MALLVLEKPKKKSRITSLEKRFDRLVPGWTVELRKKARGKDMSSSYEKDLDNFKTCFVGSVREKLGLSKSYHDDRYLKSKGSDPCVSCTRFAETFCDFYNYDIYLSTLQSFEMHLVQTHGKEF